MKLDVLAIGAHPDDVELGCGGTLALLSAAGKRTGILHLSRGEAGTRGTAEQRIEEARRAGVALGAEVVDFLDCGDGALRNGRAEEDSLIDVLRRYRPELVLGPPPRDRHPDHDTICKFRRENFDAVAGPLAVAGPITPSTSAWNTGPGPASAALQSNNEHANARGPFIAIHR